MKILFIGHEATRSGAPISLLRLMGYLKKTIDDPYFEIILLKGGPLISDYKTFGKTKIIKNNVYPLSWKTRIRNRLRKHLFSFVIKKRYEWYFNRFDLLFVNSSASLRFFSDIGFKTKTKSIIRVPELPPTIDELITNEMFCQLALKFDKIITVSKLVKKELTKSYNIQDNKIDIVYGAFESTEEPNLVQSKKFFKEIPEGSFIVGGAGGPSWRKGFDVFIQLANLISKKEKKIYFVWLGNNQNKFFNDASYDLNLMQNKNIIILPYSRNPADFFNSIDVFFLSSRIDPFPLVCVESNSYGKPVICFEKSGGAIELVERGGGFVVPYLDIDEAAKKILYYYNNPEILTKDGLNAKKTSVDFTIEKSGSRLLEIITEVIQDK